MALNAYLTAVQTLLHDLNGQFYTTATLSTFINAARSQIAMEGECIRAPVIFVTTAAQEVYLHSAIPPATQPLGITALLNVRSLATANLVLESRPWDYFQFYFRNMTIPPAGTPTAWCPFQQGTLGSFYVAPIPDKVYGLTLDGVWLPIALADDTTAEALPYPWTDAVQFYAAYMALVDAQRTRDADAMMQLYETYMARARGGVTPLVQPQSFPGGVASRQSPGMAPAEAAPPTAGR